ncbi:MAG: CHAT domain-containing tetratricopeptide repeat protein [Pirellulaceae bacterium]|nr:CHAT domain-containing tetratricopeptide repeat protein [Pirellulaceae bacterium]
MIRGSSIHAGLMLTLLIAPALGQTEVDPDERRAQIGEHTFLQDGIRQAVAAGEWQAGLDQATEAMTLARQLFGENSPELAQDKELWADCAAGAEQFAPARKAFEELAAFWKTKLPADSPHSARLADKLRELATIEKLTDEQRTALREAQSAIGEMRSSLAEFNLDLPDDAPPVFPDLDAVQKLAALLGPSSRQVLAAWNWLSRAFRERGDYASAVRAARESCGGKLPSHDPDGIQYLAHYGAMLAETGDLARAAPLLVEVVAREKAAGREREEGYAKILNDLALIRERQGNYAEAAKLYEQAYDVYKAVEGDTWKKDGQLLNTNRTLSLDLARVASGKSAQRLFDEAAQFQLAFGPGDDRRVLLNMASNSLLAGDFSKAKEYLDQEDASRRESAGRDQFPLIDAEGEGVRSAYYMLTRNLAEAERRARRAWQLQTANRPAGHPRTKAALSNLALLCQLNGKQREADGLARDCLRLSLAHAYLCSAVQSERQQLALADDLGRILGTFLTVTGSQTSTIGNEEVYAQVLSWKGASSLRTLQRRVKLATATGEQREELLDLAWQLEQAKRDLAMIYFRVPRHQFDGGGPALAERVSELLREIDDLEQTLADRGIARPADPAARLAALRELLDADTVLVDFVEYRKFTRLSGSVFDYGRVPWLAAFIVKSQGEIVWVDLGQSLPINTAVERWREVYGGSAGFEARGGTRGSEPTGTGTPGQTLRKLVWNEVEPYLGTAKTVVVSPAGSLGRLAFGALPGKTAGTYLLEERAIAYAAVPQLLPDLATRPARLPAGTGPTMLLVGDVDFAADPGAPAAAVASRATPRGESAPVDLSALPPLPFTCPEVLTIGKLFESEFPRGQATILRGPAATETALREGTAGQHFLHLATHGFFGRVAGATGSTAADPLAAARLSPLSLSVSDDRYVAGYHPSLLCGLTLAGASRPLAADKDDGVLTALEVETLDVSNLELVALSACQTGLGQTAASDGLLGLQRAFQVGGTRTVVASLWPVDDASTRQLMTDFYRNLWVHKLSRIEALRQAQLTLLKDGLRPESRLPIATEFPDCAAAPGGGVRDLTPVKSTRPSGKRLSPYFWAPLVLSGAWN